MAHEIRKNRFFAHDGEPAWHKLGTVDLREGVTFGEGVNEARDGCTYSLEQSGTYDDATGIWEPLECQRNLIFRDPKAGVTKSFGQVSKDFSIVTPDRLIELMDPVLKGYDVHTAGMLREGKSIFLALKAGESEILGEPHSEYITFDLSFEIGRVMRAYSTMVRTVCANTQAIGIGNASLALDIPHTGNVDAMATLGAAFIRSYQESKDFFTFLMESFAAYQMNSEEIDAVLSAAFPDPKRPKILAQTIDRLTPEQIATLSGDGVVSTLLDTLSSKERAYVNSVSRTVDDRETCKIALDRFNRDFPEFQGSAYATYNALTQTADWRVGKGNIAASVAGGDRWREKIRGCGMLQEIAGVTA